METVTCNECGTTAEAKTSKANRVFFICPKCPGNGDHSNKFLTFLDEIAAYKKKKVVPKKRKTTPVEAEWLDYPTIVKRRKIEESNTITNIDSKVDDLLKRVDQVIFKIEQIISSIPVREEMQSDSDE